MELENHYILTALRYAGCDINKDLNLKDVNNLDVKKYKEKLNNWYENIETYENNSK